MRDQLLDHGSHQATNGGGGQLPSIGCGRSTSELPPSPQQPMQLSGPEEGALRLPRCHTPGLRRGRGGHLLRRELLRFQLERRTPERAASAASPLLTTGGALQAKKQGQ